jgi:hypothetical protein
MIKLTSVVYVLLGSVCLWMGPLSKSRVPALTFTPTNVQYSYVSQRWLSHAELNRFKDAHGLVLAVRLRLSNQTDWYVEYLAASTGSILPVGYQYYRPVGEKEWKSLPPSRGRSAQSLPIEFKGDGYRWLELPPGASVEFEIYNWSSAREEHAFSSFIKTDPDRAPNEIVSDTFKPLVR